MRLTTLWDMQVMAHSTAAWARRSLIRIGLESVALSGAERLFPAAAGRGVIFTLHHVRPAEHAACAPNAGLAVTPEFLEQAILASRERGLVPVHLDDLPALLSDPGETRKFAVFTLDDGYRDNAAFAAPVFRRHGIPYTIYLTAGFVERSRTIWWETAAALVARSNRLEFDFGAGGVRLGMETPARKHAAFARLAKHVANTDEDEAVTRIDTAARAAGIDPMRIVDTIVMDRSGLRILAQDPLVRFGAHTVTHVNLARVDEARLHGEIADSTRAVERLTGRKPTSFAYPYGWSEAAGQREAKAVAAAGFATAVTTRPGVLGADKMALPTLLPRVSLNGHFQTARHVRALISGILFRMQLG